MIDLTRIQNARILIVDDERSNVLLLEKILAAAGHANFLSTGDPRQVLDLYHAFCPDILLLDLHMPYLNGFEVLAALRAALNEGDYIPILMLTADITQPTRLKALECGAKDFLTKPFDQVEVVNRIRNILEVRLLYTDLKDQNQVLEQKVRERTRELMETRLEIIHRLGQAAEYRDKGTGLHILHIGHYSACLARAAHLPHEMQDIILASSPMHDIGKIGIPDSILLKSGRLNTKEREIMKTHTTIGAELLAGHNSPLMKTASAIALTHHERWDGEGYPTCLKGEDIPLGARIIAVADAYDAMTSDRPYRGGMAPRQALDIIAEEMGKQFCPVCARAFLQMKRNETRGGIGRKAVAKAS